jgi:hypothetical protein
MTDRALHAATVDLQREAPGRARWEAQLDWSLWRELRLEVVAVEMQRQRPIGRPPEGDVVPLLDPEEPLALWQPAVLEREFEEPRLAEGTAGHEDDEPHDQGRQPGPSPRHCHSVLTPPQLPPICSMRAAACPRAAATSGKSFSGT